VILPEGFKLAPKERLSDEIKAKTKGVFIQPYSKEKQNILVVGPISGDKNQDIIFPILSPDPAKDKGTYFYKYPIYLGGNRGRGQVYPDGSKSNNTVYNTPVAGTVTSISALEKGGYDITVTSTEGKAVKETIPPGPELLVKQGQVVIADQPLTTNPNVGGFGQAETEIVLQNPVRIQGLILFFISVIITQVFLVLKKKQFERVQLAEMNF
jgi:apocytochrome f